jgi:hypothetical protein
VRAVGTWVKPRAAPTLVEEDPTRVLEPREEALLELRRALGLAHVMGDLPIQPDDFNEQIELRTSQEVDQYIENLECAAQAAGYMQIAMPDLTRPNSPPTTPPMQQHAIIFADE